MNYLDPDILAEQMGLGDHKLASLRTAEHLRPQPTQKSQKVAQILLLMTYDKLATDMVTTFSRNAIAGRFGSLLIKYWNS